MQPSPSHRNRWQSLSLWVGLTALGYIFAGFLHMPGDGPPGVYSPGELNLFAGLVGFLFGTVTGLVVAGLQKIALKSWTVRTQLWILLNATGFGLVHALNDAGLFNLLPTSQSLVIDGLVIGVAQAISLRKTLFRIYLWPVVTGAAWFLGFQTVYELETVLANNPLGPLFVGYSTGGLTIGVITGAALKFLLSEGISQSGSHADAEKNNRWSNLSSAKKYLLVGISVGLAAAFLILADTLFGVF